MSMGIGDAQNEHAHVTWTPPVFDTSRPPQQLLSRQLDQVPLAEAGSPGRSVFARLAKWCPDGSVALAQCEDRTFRYLHLSHELLGITADITMHPPVPRHLVQPSPILDYVWYPTAAVRDPASFCFVASVRECPVKLLDASDGRLRASYRIVDHRERQIAPHSLAFNLGANRLYCGFEDAIEVFDVHRPGEGTRLHTTPSKKSRDGLKGIIAALAFAPDASSDLYAAGSLSPSAPSSANIALFSETTGEVPLMFVGAEGANAGAGYGVRASVSQLMFNPARPYLLYASFRRLDAIYAWDLRGDVGRPVETLNVSQFPAHEDTPFRRESAGCATQKTNQRLRFDIDLGGRWLASGDECGGISVFDLATQQPEPSAADAERTENAPRSHQAGNAAAMPGRAPALRFAAHGDAVGSVAFHPLRPLVLSVSGSRHFHAPGVRPGSTDDTTASDETDSDDDIVEASSAPSGPGAVRYKRSRPQPVALDTSVKLWEF